MATQLIPFILKAADIAARTMEMLPDYPQKKRKELYSLRMEYKDELFKEIEYIDNLVLEHRYDRLRTFIETFHQELLG